MARKNRITNGDETSECGQFRIDCALGIELKEMRLARELTLMTMSEDICWQPARLSKYEQRIGALTDRDDARVIEDYCSRQGWLLSDSAIALSNKSVKTDLAKTRKLICDLYKSAGVKG